jgi:uncharacterized protein
METTNNAQIVQSIYDALGRGDLAAVLGRVDETSLWDFNVARSEVPWHAPVRGPAAIGKFLGEFMENITLEAFEPRLFDAGEEVFALVRLAYTIKRTGRRVDQEQLQRWSLANGRVTRLRHFEDTAQVIDAWRGTTP